MLTYIAFKYLALNGCFTVWDARLDVDVQHPKRRPIFVLLRLHQKNALEDLEEHARTLNVLLLPLRQVRFDVLLHTQLTNLVNVSTNALAQVAS